MLVLYLIRDMYGVMLAASFSSETILNSSKNLGIKQIKKRKIVNTKQLAYAMLQKGTSKDCFNAAWKLALAIDAVSPGKRIKEVNDQLIEYAKQESDQVEAFIRQLVNNPSSKFYLKG